MNKIKLIHYRDSCIGCAICFEMQPDLWRMSRKDGKASLVGGILNKKVYQRDVPLPAAELQAVAEACPVRIIKVIG